MKKNQFKTVVLLIILVFSLYIFISTFAKFASSANGSGSVTVGKWHVKIGDVDISSGSNTHEISSAITMNVESNPGVTPDKIVPRSTFSGSFIIDTLDTDVDIMYSLKIRNSDVGYGGTNGNPDFRVTKVIAQDVQTDGGVDTFVNDQELVCDEEDNYIGRIELSKAKKKVTVFVIWEPKNGDNAVGIEEGNVVLPINVKVEQNMNDW